MKYVIPSGSFNHPSKTEYKSGSRVYHVKLMIQLKQAGVYEMLFVLNQF